MRKQLNIILADDDNDDCLLFREAIEELSVPVDLSIVHDGVELMKNLVDNSTALPDVLFLDLNMPRKNGVECLNEIKNNPELERLPIIIFSTGFESGIANQLYEAGARYYIRKPSDFSSLKKLISQVLTYIKKAPVARVSPKNFLLTLSSK